MSTRMKLLLAATLVLGPLAGFIVGRRTAPAAEDGPVLRELARQRALLEEHLARAAAPRPEVYCATAPSTGSIVDAAWLRAELARVLREELAPHAGASGAGPGAVPPEPPPRSLAALQEGHQVLDNATRARRWTDEDADALRHALIDMTDAQRDEVMRRFVTTINSNTLDIQSKGAPL